MVDIEIRSDIDEFVDNLGSKMTPALAKGLLKAANFAGGAIAEEVNQMFSKGSGELARSFLPARFVSAGDGKVGAGAFSDLPYARIHDEGGTIVPKQMKYLAIPLTKEAKLRWPRDWPVDELFAFKSKSGNLILAKRTSSSIKPQYVLKKSVDIGAKNYIKAAMKKSEQTVTEIVDEAIQHAIDEAKK